MNGYYKLLTWMITIGVLVLFVAGIAYRVNVEEKVQTSIAIYGFVGLFVIVFLFEFIPQILSTYIPVTTALLFGMDPFAVCIISIVASAMGSIPAFEIGRKASRRFINDVIDKRAHRKVERYANTWGKWVVVIAAFSPLPYIPMLFGALKLTRKNFYIYGVLAKTVDFIVSIAFLTIFI
ncbi:MAG: VTT domain-containing protein [archaeon]|jgi:membrane protein YqaA with SNARE-associated domain|nr:VTT domain-containing protein [archaeon]